MNLLRRLLNRPAPTPGAGATEPRTPLLLWGRLRWWSPEARVLRDRRRYGGRVLALVAHMSEAEPAEIEEAVHRAFLALHRRYQRGRTVRNVRVWAAQYALMVMSRRDKKRE
jgi:hypothetical protein